MPAPQQLRVRDIWSFYGPLVLTSQMMTLSNPLINLHLSRGQDPTVELAAYSVCFGATVFLHAPLLITPNVSAGIVKGPASYRQVLRTALALGLLLALADLALAFTPLGRLLFEGLLDCTPRVAAQAQRTAASFAPIPILLGLRGMGMGLAMSTKRTGHLTRSTFSRLSAIVLFLVLAYAMGWRSAPQAAWALTMGIATETAWITWRTRHVLGEMAAAGETALSPRRMFDFAFPLALSGYAWTGLRPLVNGILGRCADSEAAQASFGVLHPLILLAASALWGLQATGQVLATDRSRARSFLAFAFVTTLVLATVTGILGWIEPVRIWLLTQAFTLPPRLLHYVDPAMTFLFLAPFFLGLRAATKGVILATGDTKIITWSSATYLGTAVVVGMSAVKIAPEVNGAVLGVLLISLVEMVEAVILGITASRRLQLVGTHAIPETG